MSAPTSDKAGIRQVIHALKAGGWELDFVHDGEEDQIVSTETEAVAAIVAVDDAFLNVKKREANGVVYEIGWVRFVMGNDPDEVVCDYTTNLTEVGTLTHGWYFDA